MKPAPRSGAPMRGGPGTSDPGRFQCSGAPLSRLILTAYEVKDYQMSGPAWLSTVAFDVVATVPVGATRQQFNTMLRNLLVERFGLRFHHESRELMGYELQIGKDGHKLQAPVETANEVDDTHKMLRLQALIDRTAPRGLEGTLVFWDRNRGWGVVRLSNGLLRAVGVSQTIADVIARCEGEAHLPIVDKTGLTGRYDYSIDYARDSPADRQDTPAVASAMDPGPDFVTAFQKQLGFKLEKKKLPFDVLVIDGANRAPTGN